MANELAALSNELAAAVDGAGKSVVAVHARPRFSSSGVFWKPGVIVTAEHGIRREEEIRVTLPDGKSAAASLVGSDPGSDLAVLKVETDGIPVLAARQAPVPGNLALAIGRAEDSGVNATLGIVSAVGPAWRTWRGGRLDSYIRLDLTLYPGSTGALVVNVAGEALGIATPALSRIAGVAIPAPTIDRVVEEILKRGRVARGYLGVGLQPVELSEHQKGLIVLSLEPEGPAAKAGILIGDILVSVGGKRVEDTEDIQTALDGRAVGSPIEAEISRGGESRSLSIAIGEQPGGTDMRGFGEIAERLRRSTVQVFTEASSGSARTPRGGGSGVIWRADGAVLTNAHVARHDAPEVELWDGRRFPSRVVSRDSRRDLALLQIDRGAGLPGCAPGFRLALPAGRPAGRLDSLESASTWQQLGLDAAPTGDSSALRPGELVLAIGSPLGFAGALSRGVVHSTGPIEGMGKHWWIRAGVQLAPGNSGGPLANARGEVIGINTAIFNGLGLAIPSNAAADFVARGPRPALGVTLRPEGHGLRILQIEPGGPAARASLMEGDLLLGTFDDLADALDSGRDPLALKFLRTNRVRETHVQIGRRAEAA